MSNPVLTVITCPRPGGASYVDRTLGWIEEEEASARLSLSKFIICDSEPVFRAGWQTRRIVRGWTPHALPANKWAGWEALSVASEQGSDLLFLEDDIEPLAPGALRRLVETPIPDDAAWMSFFHPSRPPGRYPAPVFMYCQALKIPRRTVSDLLRIPLIVPGDWEGARGFDEALAALAPRAAEFYQAAPIVAHIGEVSVANPSP